MYMKEELRLALIIEELGRDPWTVLGKVADPWTVLGKVADPWTVLGKVADPWTVLERLWILGQSSLQSIFLVLKYINEPRVGESANFLAALAPAPDFFFKKLRLLIFSQAAPAPAHGIFFEPLWLRLQGAKKNQLRLLTIG